MMHAIFLKQQKRPRLRAAFIVLLMISIFIADTVTDFEIAFAVFYIAVILIAIGFLSTRGVIALAVLCICLTVVSLLLTRHGSFEAGLFNCGISACAIGITTYLGLKTVAAQAAVYDAQEQFGRMARLTRLGELTASIAHEINQPLAAVTTSADACRRWLDHSPPNLDRARQAAERIVGDAKRASDVIVRVRGLAKNDVPHRESFDLNAAAAEAIEMARHEMERNSVVLRLDLAQDMAMVMADKIQIQQVISNLLLNAIEAMTDVPSFKRELAISSSYDDATGATFIVADSGIGMKQSTIDHLFEAFWTTKESGMGIGLSISRSIIEAHGGRISVTSAPRMGTTVQFSLPAKEDDQS
ncbi:HAMP domain-containing histidine kinase [Rhizobium sp. B230/85]|nr:HAMP domain-containing histidine kinase [Rhizobium sp. B209b/85]QXZ97964.1 HAMP domain-containing histidine kinase [Rhizobium sp. B230/85]